MAIIQSKHENLSNVKNKATYTAREIQILKKTIEGMKENRDDDIKCYTHLRSNIIFILIHLLMDRFAYEKIKRLLLELQSSTQSYVLYNRYLK